MASRKRQGRTVESSATTTSAVSTKRVSTQTVRVLEAELRALRDELAHRDAELLALRERVGRLETTPTRPQALRKKRLKAFDGRAAPTPSPPGPRCPGCRLPPVSDADRCEFCGFLFSALPPSRRPRPVATDRNKATRSRSHR